MEKHLKGNCGNWSVLSVLSTFFHNIDDGKGDRLTGRRQGCRDFHKVSANYSRLSGPRGQACFGLLLRGDNLEV